MWFRLYDQFLKTGPLNLRCSDEIECGPPARFRFKRQMAYSTSSTSMFVSRMSLDSQKVAVKMSLRGAHLCYTWIDQARRSGQPNNMHLHYPGNNGRWGCYVCFVGIVALSYNCLDSVQAV